MARVTSFITFALFFVSLASGLIIVFAYHPSVAFQSVQEINFILPYGLFFRKLHYFSSEAFTIFIFLHIFFEFYKKKIYISSSSWNYSILAFLVVIILMFSGFVLKADLSANAAAQVALNLIKETPILKELLPLIKDTTIFYYKFFIWHILFLPLILGYAVYKHTKALHVEALYLSIAVGISIVTMIIFTMPRDIITGESVKNLTSPWFFIGAENLLLKSVSPTIINLILAIPFFLMLLYFYAKNKNIIKILLLAWLIAYSYISVFGL